MVCRKRTTEFYLLCMMFVITVCYLAFMFMNQFGEASIVTDHSSYGIQNRSRPTRPTWSLVGLLSSWSSNSSYTHLTNRNAEKPRRRNLLVPIDTELDNMDEYQIRQFYWKYINTVQVLCRNQTRFGSFKDGGKEVCIDDEFLPKKPCLVYSFGSNYQFDFEEGIIRSFGCEIHTFDPTVNPRKKKIPDGIHFHLKGLAGRNHLTPKHWQMATLETIVKELNHTNATLDLLKIDIEGSEWDALFHMYKTGVLRRTKQLLIEIHFANQGSKKHNWGEVSSRDQLKVLRGLYEEDFRIFMREHNLYSLVSFKSDYNTKYTNVNEISLINMNYRNG